MMLLLLILGFQAPSGDGIPWTFPAAPRIVAIGDVHGDLAATRRALRLAGAIDEHDHWVGGSLVLVQTGDQLDRGDDEIEIVQLFERLAKEAAAAGGAVHALNGNHELMNVYHDYRYVTDGAYEATQTYLKTHGFSLSSEDGDAREAARTSAFGPGGPLAKVFGGRNTMVRVGDTLFVHGGVLPAHVKRGIGAMNAAVRAWCLGLAPKPDWVRGSDSPIWARQFSMDTEADDCALLAETLALTGAKRMVVGHTIQETGINDACEGRVWRIDVGMARHYGSAPAQVLVIEGDTVTVSREGGENAAP